jgi:Flp pilus assembly protein CpaB
MMNDEPINGRVFIIHHSSFSIGRGGWLMRKRTLISALIGLAALVGALVVARVVARQVQAQVVSAPVVVARQVIPPQTVITAAMLATREFPRAIASAPIYRDPQELVGRVARVEIVPDAPIFHSYAVSAAEARFSADAQAVAVALKVDTARAVGGLVTPGQRVDVWRIARAQPPRDLDPPTLLALSGAGVELVARDLRVLAVRTSGGGQAVQAPAFGLTGAEDAPAATSNPTGGTISVVTVEAAQAAAPALVQLMGELGNVYDVWLTLAPLVRAEAAVASAPAAPDKAALLLALTPSPTPTASPIPTVAPPPPAPPASPTPAPAVVVKPGQAAGLNVRAGPGLDYGVLGQAVAGDQLAPLARDESQQWLLVCCVDGGRDGVADDLGWLLAGLVDVQGVDVSHLPLRPAPPKPTPTPRSLADATGLDFRPQVEYRQAPGDKRLNYVRARAVAADGAGLGLGLTLAWPGGAVTCPGDTPPKADGWCEFTATEGEFTVSLAGRAQPVTVTLPQHDQHTVAVVVFRRLW